jgi:hypothetical protein
MSTLLSKIGPFERGFQLRRYLRMSSSEGIQLQVKGFHDERIETVD